MYMVEDVPQMFHTRIVKRFGDNARVRQASQEFIEFITDLQERGTKHIPAFCVDANLSSIEEELLTGTLTS